MSVEIRNAAPEEFASAIDVMSTAFLERPDLARVAAAVSEVWDPARTWVALDGASPCGTFRSFETELTVPGGGRLPAAAVSGVTVLPSHRRRGILSALAAREHAAIRDRGEAVAVLHASEYRIYGRFGYGPATHTATWTVNAGATAVRQGSGGSVRLAAPDAGTRDAVRNVFEAWRMRRAGEIRRRDHTWDIRLGLREDPDGQRWKGFVALRRDAAGEVDGFVRYKGETRWEEHLPRGRIDVQELIGLTPEAEAALWRFILETDLVTTVRAEDRPSADPLRWLLTNSRAASTTGAIDSLWVRLFDVPRALEARAWERTGGLVLEVVEDDANGCTRRLALDVSPDGATCRGTDREPDLTLPVAALGAAYLGGTRLRDVVLQTGVDEHRPGALAEADALFRAADEPWCSTDF